MKKKVLGGLLAVSMIATMGAFNVSVSAAEKDNADIKIGFSSKDNSDTFVAAIADAAEAEAKELGVELLMYDAGGDVNKQISDCETLLAAGVDALVVIPQSVEGSAPVVSMANDAGVPIIVDNGDIGDKNYTAFVGCTDQESGELLGKWFMEESGLAENAQARELAERFAGEGKTPLLFAADGRITGVIAVADTIREDSRAAIARFREMCLHVVMLTGDNRVTAEAIRKEVGVE